MTIVLSLYLLLTRRKAGAIGDSIRSLVAFLTPCVLLLVASFGYYGVRAGVHVLLHDLVVFPLTGLSGPKNSPSIYLRQLPDIHGLGSLLQATPFFVIVALVPYVYLITLCQLWKKPPLSETRRQQILLHCVAGLALFVAICSGPTFFRLSTVAPLAIVCFVWLIEQSRSARTLRRALFGFTLCFFAWLPMHRQIQPRAMLSLPTGEVAFTDDGSYELTQWMQARTHPGDSFFNDDGISFYLKLRNPTHAEFVNNDAFTSSQDIVRILAAMRQQPPRYIAILPGMPETPFDHAGPFRIYVHSKYCLAQTFLISSRKFAEEIWGICPNKQ